ncbi:hypothetical protein Pmani_013770 [Petrolisthes manimaculis]|uniref:Uncharacterized protein n=1 Tax=Petrolisthes manimaculis TaxID=1843537 RepID=A0AAE1U9B4_9EUCA|nr:hypothetical protein Pmani_013770 [Petrolisthes manimaculis]
MACRAVFKVRSRYGRNGKSIMIKDVINLSTEEIVPFETAVKNAEFQYRDGGRFVISRDIWRDALTWISTHAAEYLFSLSSVVKKCSLDVVIPLRDRDDDAVFFILDGCLCGITLKDEMRSVRKSVCDGLRAVSRSNRGRGRGYSSRGRGGAHLTSVASTRLNDNASQHIDSMARGLYGVTFDKGAIYGVAAQPDTSVPTTVDLLPPFNSTVILSPVMTMNLIRLMDVTEEIVPFETAVKNAEFQYRDGGRFVISRDIWRDALTWVRRICMKLNFSGNTIISLEGVNILFKFTRALTQYKYREDDCTKSIYCIFLAFCSPFDPSHRDIVDQISTHAAEYLFSLSSVVKKCSLDVVIPLRDRDDDAVFFILDGCLCGITLKDEMRSVRKSVCDGLRAVSRSNRGRGRGYSSRGRGGAHLTSVASTRLNDNASQHIDSMARGLYGVTFDKGAIYGVAALPDTSVPTTVDLLPPFNSTVILSPVMTMNLIRLMDVMACRAVFKVRSRYGRNGKSIMIKDVINLSTEEIVPFETAVKNAEFQYRDGGRFVISRDIWRDALTWISTHAAEYLFSLSSVVKKCSLDVVIPLRDRDDDAVFFILDGCLCGITLKDEMRSVRKSVCDGLRAVSRSNRGRGRGYSSRGRGGAHLTSVASTRLNDNASQHIDSMARGLYGVTFDKGAIYGVAAQPDTSVPTTVDLLPPFNSTVILSPVMTMNLIRLMDVMACRAVFKVRSRYGRNGKSIMIKDVINLSTEEIVPFETAVKNAEFQYRDGGRFVISRDIWRDALTWISTHAAEYLFSLSSVVKKCSLDVVIPLRDRDDDAVFFILDGCLCGITLKDEMRSVRKSVCDGLRAVSRSNRGRGRGYSSRGRGGAHLTSVASTRLNDNASQHIDSMARGLYGVTFDKGAIYGVAAQPDTSVPTTVDLLPPFNSTVILSPVMTMNLIRLMDVMACRAVFKVRSRYGRNGKSIMIKDVINLSTEEIVPFETAVKNAEFQYRDGGRFVISRDIWRDALTWISTHAAEYLFSLSSVVKKCSLDVVIPLRDRDDDAVFFILDGCLCGITLKDEMRSVRKSVCDGLRAVSRSNRGRGRGYSSRGRGGAHLTSVASTRLNDNASQHIDSMARGLYGVTFDKGAIYGVAALPDTSVPTTVDLLPPFNSTVILSPVMTMNLIRLMDVMACRAVFKVRSRYGRNGKSIMIKDVINLSTEEIVPFETAVKNAEFQYRDGGRFVISRDIWHDALTWVRRICMKLNFSGNTIISLEGVNILFKFTRALTQYKYREDDCAKSIYCIFLAFCSPFDPSHRDIVDQISTHAAEYLFSLSSVVKKCSLDVVIPLRDRDDDAVFFILDGCLCGITLKDEMRSVRKSVCDGLRAVSRSNRGRGRGYSSRGRGGAHLTSVASTRLNDNASQHIDSMARGLYGVTFDKGAIYGVAALPDTSVPTTVDLLPPFNSTVILSPVMTMNLIRLMDVMACRAVFKVRSRYGRNGKSIMIKDVINLSTEEIVPFETAVKNAEFQYRDGGRFVISRDIWRDALTWVRRICMKLNFSGNTIISLEGVNILFKFTRALTQYKYREDDCAKSIYCIFLAFCSPFDPSHRDIVDQISTHAAEYLFSLSSVVKKCSLDVVIPLRDRDDDAVFFILDGCLCGITLKDEMRSVRKSVCDGLRAVSRSNRGRGRGYSSRGRGGAHLTSVASTRLNDNASQHIDSMARGLYGVTFDKGAIYGVAALPDTSVPTTVDLLPPFNSTVILSPVMTMNLIRLMDVMACRAVFKVRSRYGRNGKSIMIKDVINLSTEEIVPFETAVKNAEFQYRDGGRFVISRDIWHDALTWVRRICMKLNFSGNTIISLEGVNILFKFTRALTQYKYREDDCAKSIYCIFLAFCSPFDPSHRDIVDQISTHAAEYLFSLSSVVKKCSLDVVIPLRDRDDDAVFFILDGCLCGITLKDEMRSVRKSVCDGLRAVSRSNRGRGRGYSSRGRGGAHLTSVASTRLNDNASQHIDSMARGLYGVTFDKGAIYGVAALPDTSVPTTVDLLPPFNSTVILSPVMTMNLIRLMDVNMPLSENLTCEKARTLYDDLNKKSDKDGDTSETFVASKG